MLFLPCKSKKKTLVHKIVVHKFVYFVFFDYLCPRKYK